MEVGFVIAAVRRYWYTVLVGLLLGTMAGVVIKMQGTAVYASTAVLLISPPESADGQAVSTGPDRYVLAEISQLLSLDVAAIVAEEVGGLTAEQVRRSVVAAQETGTDVVDLTVTTSSPVLSQRIAQAYVTTYFDGLNQRIADTNEPNLQTLEQQAEDLNQRLEDIDAAIADAMEPYLPDSQTGDQQAYPPIPALEQVAPSLSTARQTVLAEYAQVSSALTALHLRSELQVVSRVIQAPNLPTISTAAPRRIYVVAGFIGGLGLGVVGAAVQARLSRRVLDATQVGELLDGTLVRVMPDEEPTSTLPGVSKRLAEHLDDLSSLAVDAAGSSRCAVTAVLGASEAAGTTTLALRLALRAAENGQRVLLVDADPRRAELVDRLVPDKRVPTIAEASTRAQDRPIERVPATTRIAGLRVVSTGDLLGSRIDAAETVARLANHADADVMIIDCGDAQHGLQGVQIARGADLVALTVPIRHQRVADLDEVARKLLPRQGSMVAVATSARRGAALAPRTSDQPEDV